MLIGDSRPSLRRLNAQRWQRLLDDTRKCDHAPDSVTYNTLVNGYCRQGNTHQALVQSGSSPNAIPSLVAYSCLINGLCLQGRTVDALHIVEDMPDKGLKPYVVTYGTVIGSYCKNGQLEQAFFLLTELQWLWRRVLCPKELHVLHLFSVCVSS
ncbi:Pentatricopeptide repeat-containing protein [Nymphaea thermarum]|nr:Pentatricopeptide repeat-containing protein [Nymphaea thermarum]